MCHLMNRKEGKMIILDKGILREAQELADSMAADGRQVVRFQVAEHAAVTVARTKTLLILVLKEIRAEDGTIFYVGLGAQ